MVRRRAAAREAGVSCIGAQSGHGAAAGQHVSSHVLCRAGSPYDNFRDQGGQELSRRAVAR